VPESIEVEYTAGVPSAFWWRGSRVAVERAGGPERLSGDWWRDGYARDYWRCEGEAGEFLIYLDRERCWYVQGWYD
jgi:protein ImuB